MFCRLRVALTSFFTRMLGISLLCLSSVCLADSQNRVTFTFAYDTQQGFPSFMGNGQQIPAQYPGTYIDILRMVEQRLPITLELTRLPWERCKAYLAANRVSAINSSFKPSRARIGRFPRLDNGALDGQRRITSDAYRFYAHAARKLEFNAQTMQVFPVGSLLAAPLGYSVVDDLNAQGLVVEQHPEGLEGLVKLLMHDRVRGVVAHETQMNFLLAQNASLARNIVPVEPAIQRKDYFILISRAFYREHPELAEQIWAEIADLRETMLPQLLAQYHAYYGSEN